jgi:hypothetical protein
MSRPVAKLGVCRVCEHTGPCTQRGPPCCDFRQPAKHIHKGAAYLTRAHTGPHFEVTPLVQTINTEMRDQIVGELILKLSKRNEKFLVSYCPFFSQTQSQREPTIPLRYHYRWIIW